MSHHLTVAERRRPDDSLLADWLQACLGPQFVSVEHREPRNSGSFPKEIVTYRARNGEDCLLFCKYSGPRDDSFGHRGGVPHETSVYRSVLAGSRQTAPRLIGAGEDARFGNWLVLEYLEGGERLMHEWEHLPGAGSWLGRFHRESAARIEERDLQFLTTYDLDYYLGWSRRLRQFLQGSRHRERWIDSLIDQFEGLIEVLIRPPLTIIHAEFTPKNVMVVNGSIYPTDWESAAIAAGEIDLMTLLDGCRVDEVDRCTVAYRKARWEDSPPTDFATRRQIADLYLHFRWLGEKSDPLQGDVPPARLARLRRVAVEMGIVP